MKPSPYFGSKHNYSIYVVNGKMGLANGFNLITQPKYDVIYPFLGEYAIVKIGERKGLIDCAGREIIPVQYEYLFYKNENTVWFDCNGVYYYIDFKKQIFNKKCKHEEYIDSISNLLHKQRKEISVEYWDEDNEKFGYGFFLLDNEESILYTEKSNKVLLSDYNISTCDFENDVIIIHKNNKYGIANTNEDIIVPLQYDKIEWSDSGIFAARIGNKWGFIDAYGNVKIAFSYDLAGSFCKGQTWVMLNGQSGVIDSYGRKVVPMGDYSIRILDNGTTVMVSNHFTGKRYTVYGWPPINLQHSYDELNFNFNQNPNFVRVKCGYRYGVIKLNGEIILEPIYDFIDFNIGSHFVVQRNNKYGIIDLNGRAILPITYDDISRYGGEGNSPENLFYRVRMNNKIGLMNQRMQLVIPIQYDDISYDSTYNANRVRLGNEYGMVDFEHNMLIPFSKNYL